MRQVICTVRDAKSELFARPMFVQQAGVAIRSFTDEVNRKDPENMMYNHPSDFALYELGHYNDVEGKIIPHDIPKLLVQADQVKVA